jgi:hypothetical protein
MTLTRTVVIALALAIVPAMTHAKPGDPRVVQGTLVWSPGAAGEPFVVVRADDGKYYVADLSAAQSRGTINVGDRLSVVGVEGVRPFEVATAVIGAGDSALSVPSPAPATQSPAAAASPLASPPTMTPPGPPAAPATERPWRRIDGKVQSVSKTQLTLREATGGTVSVDISRLTGDLAGVVQAGDAVSVFVAAAEGDDRLVAVGFVHAEPATGSALPRGR